MQTTDKSSIYEPQLGNVGTTWTSILGLVRKGRSYVTAECHLSSKETILADKLVLCKKHIRKQKSYRILDQVLISSEKALVPYWTDWHQERSSLLWLPTKIVLQGLGQNSSNFSSNETVENSWFSTERYSAPKSNLPKICLRSCMSSLVEQMDYEGTKTKSKKIRVYPTKQQVQVFRQWIGTARALFNKTVSYLKQDNTVANWKSIKTPLIKDMPEWSEKTPYQVRSVAIRDCCNAVSAAKKKFRKTGEFQEVGFRSRKDSTQSVYIPESAVRKDGIYPTITGGVLKWAEKLPKEFGDCRLVYHNEQWFVSFSTPIKQVDSDNQGTIVALDPGVRTFMTLFSENCFLDRRNKSQTWRSKNGKI